jgi:hypothetical protein
VRPRRLVRSLMRTGILLLTISPVQADAFPKSIGDRAPSAPLTRRPSSKTTREGAPAIGGRQEPHLLLRLESLTSHTQGESR